MQFQLIVTHVYIALQMNKHGIMKQREVEHMKKLVVFGLVAVGSVVTFEVLRRRGVVAKIGSKVKEAVSTITDDRTLKVEVLFENAKEKVMDVTNKTKEALHKAFDKAQEEVEEVLG